MLITFANAENTEGRGCVQMKTGTRSMGQTKGWSRCQEGHPLRPEEPTRVSASWEGMAELQGHPLPNSLQLRIKNVS